MRDLADLVRSRRLRHLGSVRVARLRRFARQFRLCLRDKSARQLVWNRCQTYKAGFFDNACCKHLNCSGGRESIFVHVGHINNEYLLNCRPRAERRRGNQMRSSSSHPCGFRLLPRDRGQSASRDELSSRGCPKIPPDLVYLFPECCGYDHAMRDIADSDIEYDLGEINTSISVNEAHSNGLARVRNNSGDRDCLAASARLLLEAGAAARCPHFVFPSVGHGASSWQDEGGTQPI